MLRFTGWAAWNFAWPSSLKNAWLRNPCSCAAFLPRGPRRSQAVADRSWCPNRGSTSSCPLRDCCGKRQVAWRVLRWKIPSWRHYACWTPVRVRLCKQGQHACSKVCGEPCGDCIVPVPLPDPLPCGHAASGLVPCHLAAVPEKILCHVPVLVTYTACQHQVNVACHKAVACRMKCSQACGHVCVEPCSSCSTHQKKLGAVCRQICGKELLCGHTCHLQCHDVSTLCDCKQPCLQRCTHSVCNKRCGQACTPCAMECRWTCAHKGPCHMPCGSPCDRPICNEPCDKKLACGHKCPSICGETCPSPKFCQDCCPDEIKERTVDLITMVTYREHVLSEEPVLVLDCGHVFTLSTLDGHVALTQYYGEDGTALSLPVEFSSVPMCPDCRTPITSTQRYGCPVQKAMVDTLMQRYMLLSRRVMDSANTKLQALERRLADSAKAFSDPEKVQLKQIAKGIRRLTTKLPPTQQVYEASAAAAQRMGTPADAARDMVMRPPPIGICLEAKVYLVKANILLIKSQLESILKKGPADEKVKLLVDKVEAQFREIQSAAVESQYQQVAALAAYELATFLATVSFRINKKRAAQQDEVAAKVRVLCEHLETHPLLSIRDRYRDQTSRLRRLVMGLSAEEIREIIRVMGGGMNALFNYGSGVGHWYTCPNSHVYYIGNCDGAMQQSRCPECGAGIGGMSHQLQAGNRPAQEFCARAGAGSPGL